MLTLIIIALIAASSFHSAAKKKGYDSPRFWAYPLIVCAVIIFASILMNSIVAIITSSSELMEAYPLLVSLLAIGVECAVLAKAWKQIKNLTERK